MTDPAACLAEILGPQRMERLHQRAETMEMDGVAVLQFIVDAFLTHNSQPLQPVQGGLFANTSHPLPPPQKKIRRSAQPGLLPAATSIEREELDWRVDRVWEAHRTAWGRFWLAETGLPVRCPTQPNAEVRAAIVAGLRKHDGHLLGPDARGSWVIESQVRAAGVGIFYDPWMTGHAKDNDVTNGGKRWLSHDRPWVQQRGKPDPIERFAALYFEQRAVFDEQDRRVEDGIGKPGAPVQDGSAARPGSAPQRLPLQAPRRVLWPGGLAPETEDGDRRTTAHETLGDCRLPGDEQDRERRAVVEMVRPRAESGTN